MTASSSISGAAKGAYKSYKYIPETLYHCIEMGSAEAFGSISAGTTNMKNGHGCMHASIR
jgi:hypothetical protein